MKNIPGLELNQQSKVCRDGCVFSLMLKKLMMSSLIPEVDRAEWSRLSVNHNILTFNFSIIIINNQSVLIFSVKPQVVFLFER